MIPSTRYHAAIDIARQSRLSASIARAREQIATGSRIARPSDDPVGTATLSMLARRALDATGFASNAERARAIAAAADGALTDAQGIVEQAIERLSAALTASASADDRRIAATTLDALADDLDRVAATRDSDGAALFAQQPAPEIPIDSGTRVRPSLSASEAFAPAGTSIADNLRDAAAALRAGDLSAARSAYSRVTDASGHIAEQRGRIGIVAARVDAVIERLSLRDIAIEEQREAVDGVDEAATIAKIYQDQLTLDAAQGLFARLNQSTLFDLLR